MSRIDEVNKVLGEDEPEPTEIVATVEREPFIFKEEFLQTRPLSYSSLKHFKDSPLHYLHYIQQPKTVSPAMIMGSALDCLLLTPKDFDKRFSISPKCDRRTKEGKAQWEKFIVEAAGKTLLTDDVFAQVQAMDKAIRENEPAMDKLYGLKRVQRKLEWTDKKSGLPLIGYSDADNLELDYFLEIKTARTANPEDFFKDAFKMDYHLQAGIYKTGYLRKTGQLPKLYYIVVENTAPYGVAVYRASNEFIEYGAGQMRQLLDEFRYCIDNDLWHKSYDFRRTFGVDYWTLDLPPWARV